MKRAKKSEECAVEYRQVPYFTFWQMMGKLAYQPTNIQGICKGYLLSDNITEEGYVFRIKTEKPRRGNRPGYYPNYFLSENNQGADAPYLNED